MEDELGLDGDWPGTRLGNSTTCTIQGSFNVFGGIALHGFNAMLCFCKYQMW